MQEEPPVSYLRQQKAGTMVKALDHVQPSWAHSLRWMVDSYLNFFLWFPLCKQKMRLSCVQRWLEFNKLMISSASRIIIAERHECLNPEVKHIFALMFVFSSPALNQLPEEYRNSISGGLRSCLQHWATKPCRVLWYQSHTLPAPTYDTSEHVCSVFTGWFCISAWNVALIFQLAVP